MRFTTPLAVKFIWGFFAILFLSLAIYHYSLSQMNMPDFHPKERPGAQHGLNVQAAGADIDQPIKDFAENFNIYVHKQNATSYKQNITSCIGYVIAFFVSLFSLLLESRRPEN